MATQPSETFPVRRQYRGDFGKPSKIGSSDGSTRMTLSATVSQPSKNSALYQQFIGKEGTVEGHCCCEELREQLWSNLAVMPLRSRTGCQTCRRRKMKCDEQKPKCGQCVKSNRPCIGGSDAIFRNEGTTIQKSTRTATRANTSSPVDSLFRRDHVWVDVPQQLIFVHNKAFDDQALSGTESPFDASPPPPPSSSLRFSDSSLIDSPIQANHPLTRAQDQSTNSLHQELDIPDNVEEPIPLPEASAVTTQHALPRGATPTPVRDAERQPTQQSLKKSSPPTTGASHITSDTDGWSEKRPFAIGPLWDTLHGTPEEDADTAFLLRYFAEGPGRWLDLFDLGCYFAADVPVKAVSCPLLLYAVLALSAKYLGKGSKDGSASIRPSFLSQYTPDYLRSPHWLYKAERYYDKAIALLRSTIDGEPMAQPSNEHHLGTPGIRRRSAVGVKANPNQPKEDTTVLFSARSSWQRKADNEEISATTALLCEYEFLGASVIAWSKHLDGAKTLFDIAKELSEPGESRPSELSSSSSKARKALFWYLARQDLFSSFINNTDTRFNTFDYTMWQSVGLNLSPTGHILPSNQPSRYPPTSDDMISNSLIWLMMKLHNYIVAGDEMPFGMPESDLGIQQRRLLEYWHSLADQFESWYDGLPESFKPIVTTRPPQKGNAAGRLFPTRWFVRPMCSSTMQSYHFAMVLLLLNRPHLSTATSDHTNGTIQPSIAFASPTSLSQRLASYANIVDQSRLHAREIVCIALAQTEVAVRIHSIQPLYAAGQVLGTAPQRNLQASRYVVTGPFRENIQGSEQALDQGTADARTEIIRLLRAIEDDTGCATSYRVQQLKESWDQ